MSKSGFICREGASCYYVKSGGGGGFLNPPNDAEHLYHIEEERGGQNVGFLSLRTCLDYDWIPRQVKIRCKGLLNRDIQYQDETWIQSVYNYFRHCYSFDGIDRSASDCIIDNTDSLPVEKHLAVLFIQQWDKNHAPRLDLIANNGPLGAWSKE